MLWPWIAFLHLPFLQQGSGFIFCCVHFWRRNWIPNLEKYKQLLSLCSYDMTLVYFKFTFVTKRINLKSDADLFLFHIRKKKKVNISLNSPLTIISYFITELYNYGCNLTLETCLMMSLSIKQILTDESKVISGKTYIASTNVTE